MLLWKHKRHNRQGASITRHRTGRPPSSRRASDLWGKTWRDNSGRIVIWQRPNVWIIGWAICDLAAIFVSSKKAAGIAWGLGAASLIIWALLEVVRGVNYFRRALGLVVLLLTVGSIFKIGL